MKIPGYIAKLIASGESQTLDFKFEISDSRKLAKTLVAFSNTDGGKLLVGVKDNGRIAGIRTNEELYMLENAAYIFSRPKINFTVKQWNIEGKIILEVSIPEGQKKPFYAQDYDGKWKSYVRIKDNNYLADRILIRFWKETGKKHIKITYGRKEQLLIDYLDDFGTITLKKYLELSELKRTVAERVILDFVHAGVIDIVVEEKGCYFKLKNDKNFLP